MYTAIVRSTSVNKLIAIENCLADLDFLNIERENWDSRSKRHLVVRGIDLSDMTFMQDVAIEFRVTIEMH